MHMRLSKKIPFENWCLQPGGKKLRSDLGSIGSADGRTAERRRTVVSGARAVNGARIVNGAEKKSI